MKTLKIAAMLVVTAAALVAFVKAPANQTTVTTSTSKPSEASKWTVDVSHSNVQFTVTHLMVSEVTGHFNVFSGSIDAPTADFNGAKISFEADVNTINTDNADRDKHLKSDDFFNAEKFPKISFTSTSFKKLKGNNYELLGNLTIRDVTKAVKLSATYGGSVKDPWGQTKAGFVVKGSIKRLAYGLKWNTLTEIGGAVVSDDVALKINVEFTKGK
jgi:polyisoprenoid-binding protein YceI